MVIFFFFVRAVSLKASMKKGMRGGGEETFGMNKAESPSLRDRFSGEGKWNWPGGG